jgi:hypothetical protein
MRFLSKDERGFVSHYEFLLSLSLLTRSKPCASRPLFYTISFHRCWRLMPNGNKDYTQSPSVSLSRQAPSDNIWEWTRRAGERTFFLHLHKMKICFSKRRCICSAQHKSLATQLESEQSGVLFTFACLGPDPVSAKHTREKRLRGTQEFLKMATSVILLCSLTMHYLMPNF